MTQLDQMEQVMDGQPVMEMLSGPDKGRLFNLASRRISIGRSDDNDIVISGEGVSRNHAVIEMNMQGRYTIKDNESRNGVQVNGSNIQVHVLQSGDVIRIGNFVFRYSEQSPVAGVVGMDVEPVGDTELPVVGSQPPRPKKKKSGGINKRFLLYGGVGLLLAYVLTMNNEETTEPPASDDKAVSATDERIKVTGEPDLSNPNPNSGVKGIEDPTLKAAEQDVEKMDWQNTSLREAEQYFRKGQREYNNQNYQRAIEDFQAALNINRAHPLAQMYLTRSKSEAEAAAKKNMEVAVRYFESLQYSRAIYHFQQVIALLAHKTEQADLKVINECEKYIAVSRRRLQASELFP